MEYRKLVEYVSFSKGNAFKSKIMSFDNEIPVVKVRNFTDYSLDIKSCEKLPYDYLQEYKKFELFSNDILISSVGSWATNPNSMVGKVVRVPETTERLLLNQNIVKISSNKNELLDNYLFWLLKGDDFKNFIISNAQGSANQASITLKSIGNYEFILPDLKKQYKISNILDNLQNKIELNKQMVNTLEEIASTLFKRWFVDFEFPDENGNPYKSSGGKMIDSELGEIPINWSVTSLGSEITVIDNRGKTPPIENEKTKYPIIDVKTLNSNGRVVSLDKATKFVNKETYETWFRSGHPKIGDILLSTVGSIGEMKLYLTNIGTIAQNVVGLRSNGMSPLYIYECLNHYKNDLLSYNIGSVQPSIKVTHITKYSILKPSVEILDRFNSFSKKLTEQIMNLHDQNNELSRMRDALLPKLLSGELEV